MVMFECDSSPILYPVRDALQEQGNIFLNLETK